MRIAMSRKQWIVLASIVVVLAVGASYCARAEAADPVRPLLGGGFGYDSDHNWTKALFTGVQFPRDRYGNHWQLQVGPTWMERDSQSGTSTACVGGSHGDTGCHNIAVPWSTPAATVRSFNANVVVVFH